MNIEEIAQQAGISINKYGYAIDAKDGGPLNIQLFSELMIKECANQINSLRQRGGNEAVEYALFLAERKLNDFVAESFPRKAIIQQKV